MSAALRDWLMLKAEHKRLDEEYTALLHDHERATGDRSRLALALESIARTCERRAVRIGQYAADSALQQTLAYTQLAKAARAALSAEPGSSREVPG